jgi:hypothetical protein
MGRPWSISEIYYAGDGRIPIGMERGTCGNIWKQRTIPRPMHVHGHGRSPDFSFAILCDCVVFMIDRAIWLSSINRIIVFVFNGHRTHAYIIYSIFCPENDNHQTKKKAACTFPSESLPPWQERSAVM